MRKQGASALIPSYLVLGGVHYLHLLHEDSPSSSGTSGSFGIMSLERFDQRVVMDSSTRRYVVFLPAVADGEGLEKRRLVH